MKDVYYCGKYDKDNSGYDAAWREPYWKKLHEEAGGGEEADKIVEALKLMYTMYTDDLVKWYANLYDPGMGAYYCSTSGKENEGFLPDIESTNQALNFLVTSGMLDEQGRDFKNIFTDEMRQKLIYFIKGMQLPNGYFYNYLKTQEQLDQPTCVPKRGRDLGWCTGLLKKFGETPTYDTPNGILGNGIDKNGNPVSNYSPAVKGEDGKEVSGAALNYPEYLENRETMIAYLNENVKVVEKTYPAGNHLNATYSQYMARDKAMGWLGTDKSLTAGLIEWLNEKINPKTGYWTGEVNFNGTNGFFKIIVIYNSWGIPYPAVKQVIDSILQVILSDQPTLNNICEVYNIWSALISAKENVIRCYPESEREELLSQIDKTMKERGPEAILNTYRRQSAYQKADGAYAHAVTRGHKPDEVVHHQGGIPTGLRIEEGDVDAIGKATTGITLNIFNAYGFSPVPIYHEREWQLYKSILESAKPVIKKNTPIYR
ncbi:MAG: hypothetical protein IJ459_00325 [Clostridia bacterium]|nr:hypothetical protein [Clostridia bacterium]